MIDRDMLMQQWNELAEHLYQTAAEHGFWPEGGRNDGEAIALMHSELSEALEALRDGNPPSVKAEGFSQVEEELADVVIRLLDYSRGKGFDVIGAVLAKMDHNTGRPHKHGRRF